MKIEQRTWTTAEGWTPNAAASLGETAQLVLLFGAPSAIVDPRHIETLSRQYPRARMLGCSTAGEICGTRVFDESLVATAVHLERSTVQLHEAELNSKETTRQTGQRLAQMFDPKGLRHVFVLSDGLNVNGSELVRGISDPLPPNVAATGGLSADGAHFKRTLVLSGGSSREGKIAAVGFYGESLKIAYGCLGGWDPFGPERLITRSKGNILYELDKQPALELYKHYLGAYSKDLPSSGLLFPLSILTTEGQPEVVRTILAVNEQEQSMTFAGDIPEGSHTRFMKANFDRLIDGASGAARSCQDPLTSFSPNLAILISCVGRKLVLKQRIEEEVEAVREVFGDKTVLAGFYSYGEISPMSPSARCELHNQTMTITTFAES